MNLGHRRIASMGGTRNPASRWGMVVVDTREGARVGAPWLVRVESASRTNSHHHSRLALQILLARDGSYEV